MDDFGPDGTQPPPPPRFFPDPLAGLVTGEHLPPPPRAPVVPDVTTPDEPPRAAPAPRQPVPARPPARRPARRTAAAPAQPFAQHQQPFAQPHQPSPYAYPMAQTPVPHAPTPFVTPHAPLARRPAQAHPHTPAAPPRPAETRKSAAAGWAGCLVVLAVLGGLLLPVVRAIVDAVVKLFS